MSDSKCILDPAYLVDVTSLLNEISEISGE
jgi:hypothetical protein